MSFVLWHSCFMWDSQCIIFEWCFLVCYHLFLYLMHSQYVQTNREELLKTHGPVLDQLLTDDEFQRVLKASKAAFKAMPKWKQTQLKQRKHRWPLSVLCLYLFFSDFIEWCYVMCDLTSVMCILSAFCVCMSVCCLLTVFSAEHKLFWRLRSIPPCCLYSTFVLVVVSNSDTPTLTSCFVHYRAKQQKCNWLLFLLPIYLVVFTYQMLSGTNELWSQWMWTHTASA